MVISVFFRAFQLFKSAAEKGYRNAQFNLGVCYLQGKVVPVDFQLGLDYIQRAANQGLPEAITTLQKYNQMSPKWK